jgi:hypothetical protein
VREQPSPLPLDQETTARARDALLRHGAVPRRSVAPARRTRRLGWPVRTAGLTALAAAAAIVAVSSIGGGGHGALGVDRASAAPLVRLSRHVQAAPPPTGDATLVLRRHVFKDGSTMTGADLYLDDGSYFYAPTEAGLPAAIANDEDDGGFAARDMAAAVAALTLPTAEARTRMSTAELDPDAKPAAPPASDPKLQAFLAARVARAKANGAWSDVHESPDMLVDGQIWSNSMDALVAGGGRPDVRAGVLELLATVPEVDVTDTTYDGHAALALRSRVFPKGYEERIVIDATTGIPLAFTGGTAGEAPDVAMTYEIRRVSAGEIARQ